MTENSIQKQILLAIGSYPWLKVWRNNSGCLISQNGNLVKFGLPGSADIIGLMAPNGRFVAIEVKSQKGKQSKQQKFFQAMVESMGGLYILAKNVDDVIKLLEAEYGTRPNCK